MRRILIFPISIFLLLTGRCITERNTTSTDSEAVSVITDRVAFCATKTEISISGNIEGFKTVRLGFMVAGRINFIAVNEGQPVRQGHLISSLDPVNYTIAKELADIQVNQIQDEFNRLKLMHDNNSLSESDFAKITYGLQQAKAQQRLHTRNLEETNLYSPFNGILLKKLCEVGEIAGTGIPLFVVSDIRKIKVNAYVPENELHNLKIGQSAIVMISALGREYEGRLTEVGSAADPASRAFSLRIEVENPGLLIRPGMIAEVRIRTGKKKELPVVPVEALLHDFSDQSYVYVVDTVLGKAFRRNVSTGRLLDNKIEITSGLTENEIVVSGGKQNLLEGSKVIIR